MTVVLDSPGEQELRTGSRIDDLDGVLGETRLALSVDNGAGRTMDSVQTVRSNEERSNLRNGNPWKPSDIYTLFHPRSFPNYLCLIINRRGATVHLVLII